MKKWLLLLRGLRSERTHGFAVDKEHSYLKNVLKISQMKELLKRLTIYLKTKRKGERKGEKGGKKKPTHTQK